MQHDPLALIAGVERNAMIQRRVASVADVDPEHIQASAAEGVSDASAPLPHLGPI